MTPWTIACQGSLSITNSWSLLKLLSIESVMLANHLILCHLLLLLPSIFPSIRVYSNGSVLCIRWPKHWSFSYSISPSNEYSGLISFRIDWFDFLAAKGLSRIFSSTFRKHQFFGTEHSLWSNSHITYTITGKNIVLTIWTCVDKVMALLFNVLSRFVLSFIPRSKHILIS